MGVDRTDYLFWGLKLHPKTLGDIWEKFDDELSRSPTRRFDMVYDGMSGKYAVAGKEIAASDQYEGLGFIEISSERLGFDQAAVEKSVRDAIGITDGEFKLYLFSHYS